MEQISGRNAATRGWHPPPWLAKLVRTGSPLLAFAIPCSVLIVVPFGATNHYVSIGTLMIVAGCWVIAALFVILSLGLPALLETPTTVASAWLAVGLINLVTALSILIGANPSALMQEFPLKLAPSAQHGSAKR